jgi:UDP-2,3-diacylglucosamine pyrophosphatase LpxH
MELIEFTIPYTSKSAEFHFYPIGDIHMGCIECAENDVKRKVTEVLNDPVGYVLGMGDYAECITKNDPRFDIRNLAEWVTKDNIVESQRKKVRELFEPLAKEGKLIGLLTGNHEEEIHKRHDNDLTRNLCEDLNVPYGGYQCYIALHFHKDNGETRHVVIWHAWHGAGSAQTEGARIMRLIRLVSEIEADIFTMGHIHGAVSVYTPDRIYCNVRTNPSSIKNRKVVATLSGSWVKGFMQSTEEKPLNPHYGERQGYKPARIGSPTIIIRPYHQEIEVRV